MKHLKNIFLSN